MKAIIVDDERLALKKMENLLREQVDLDGRIELIGTYNNAHAALEAARREEVDLAFLDIEMPEINGFELAEQLLKIHPCLSIIFVTAYQEYAVKAFEMNALDYLMKPVHHSRLTVTLQRFMASKEKTARSTEEAKKAMLCCMQRLHYQDTQGRTQSFPWKTLKAPELFAYLVFHRDKTVSKQILIDLLWPDYDTERATTQLHTAIYQIRKIIKTAGLELSIKYMDEGYRLVWGEEKLDVDEWENGVRQAPPVMPETLDQHLAIMALYTGNYLEEHRYIWADYEQERMRLIWLQHVKQIAECFKTLGRHTEAIMLYQKIRETCPDLEDGYFELMKMYAAMNHQGEVRKQFQLISNRLKEEFDVSPSKELIDWYEQWKPGMKE
ncbi:response regulator [Brevibacillus ruminantium]|uniref:Response regulator n=1 Tax=Brevibacillus ruminantium TaxID=2950604 RepID=A0ABY4WIB0_9BACL|nr:response regulator [Brevibacillus ruminantium]USG66609.1 response regulator [Brevibacillus ruminantium]